MAPRAGLRQLSAFKRPENTLLRTLSHRVVDSVADLDQPHLIFIGEL